MELETFGKFQSVELHHWSKGGERECAVKNKIVKIDHVF